MKCSIAVDKSFFQAVKAVLALPFSRHGAIPFFSSAILLFLLLATGPANKLGIFGALILALPFGWASAWLVDHYVKRVSALRARIAADRPCK